MNFLGKVYRFMQGRYGPDELYKFLFFSYLFVFILNLFLRSYIINWIELFIIVFMFYRFFSKNIYRRRKENDLYLKVKRWFVKPFKNIRRNYKDRKEFIYKKCGKCKTTLRLPLPFERGIKHAKCPTCGRRISFLALRKQKVEIIRN